MYRTGRALMLGSLLLIAPLLSQAGGNSLLVPATGRCTLNTVPEQLQQALASCQQIANGGDAEAQFELGEYYYTGERAPRDFQAALRWYEKASLQGHAQAQWRLGTMFFRGEGVKANNIQAYIVLKMAAVNGAEDAMDSADLVAEQMSKDELDIASKVLGQIFRNYLIELQTAGNTPFSPLP
ncbi:tetratricopeptide repeat protein [Pseudomonas citronellolis]|uniref:tetratricopeptide repeat protein n=1 Tax=Pseudomonas citronellolis TaxID=53408 RepID=UPI0023E3DF4B|nr:tetratricopeptide repeat protein [Pseudomonas citronellolis]MDF3931245.1 tetratricopeptide repeat protein [Pseudomonas citronellolis]